MYKAKKAPPPQLLLAMVFYRSNRNLSKTHGDSHVWWRGFRKGVFFFFKWSQLTTVEEQRQKLPKKRRATGRIEKTPRTYSSPLAELSSLKNNELPPTVLPESG